MLSFKKNLTHLQWKQPKLNPVSENSTFKIKSSHLGQGGYVHKLFRSLSLPQEWSQVTHIPACIKTGEAVATILSPGVQYIIKQFLDHTHRHPSPKCHLSTVNLPHPSFRMALCLSTTLINIHASPLQQAFTRKYLTITFKKLEN